MSNLKRTNTGIVLYNKIELPYFPEGKIMPSNGLSAHEIARYSKKLKECNRTEILTLFDRLYRLTKLPQSNFPDATDESVLLQAVLNKYKETPLNEIKQAFLDAIAKDKFEVETNPYGKFSFDYFCQIINAYKKWLISSRKIRELPDAPKEEITPEQNLGALKRNCIDIVTSVNKGEKLGKIFIQPELYDLLKQNDLIKIKYFPKIDFKENNYKDIQDCCIKEYQKIKQEDKIKIEYQENNTGDGKKMAILWTVQNWISKHANSEIKTLIEGLKWVK